MNSSTWNSLTVDKFGNVRQDGRVWGVLVGQNYPDAGVFSPFKYPPGALDVVSPMRDLAAVDGSDDALLVAYSGEGLIDAIGTFLGLGAENGYLFLAPGQYDGAGKVLTWLYRTIDTDGDVRDQGETARSTLSSMQGWAQAFKGDQVWNGLPSWFRNTWTAHFGGDVFVIPPLHELPVVGAAVDLAGSAVHAVDSALRAVPGLLTALPWAIGGAALIGVAVWIGRRADVAVARSVAW